jgi:putative ABC transport system ATP-binding protein
MRLRRRRRVADDDAHEVAVAAEPGSESDSGSDGPPAPAEPEPELAPLTFAEAWPPEEQPGEAELAPLTFAEAWLPDAPPAEPEPPPGPPPPAVAGHDLVKRFGEGEAAVEALRGVSLSVEQATFSAIMGPSGSGKSTLMHILAGLDRPSSGSVEIAGVALDGLSDRELTALRRSHVGFVFQAFNLLPVLSAEENIVLPLRIAGKRPEREWVEELLEAFGLADRRKHRPAELSGGQQQRVAIARALVARPSVIFADEPTGNIDSAASEEVLGMLRTAVERFGQTVVMVTHDLVASGYSDRVVFLADGRVAGEEQRPDEERIRGPMRAR